MAGVREFFLSPGDHRTVRPEDVTSSVRKLVSSSVVSTTISQRYHEQPLLLVFDHGRVRCPLLRVRRDLCTAFTEGTPTAQVH